MNGLDGEQRPAERGPAQATASAADEALALEALSIEIRRLKLDTSISATDAYDATQALERAARRHFEATAGKDPAERERFIRTGLEKMAAEAGFPAAVRGVVLARLEGRPPEPVAAKAPAAAPVPRITLVAPPPGAAAAGPNAPGAFEIAAAAIPPGAAEGAPAAAAAAAAGTAPLEPALEEARRERRNLLIGFAIGGLGIIGGSIPLASLVWRSENDLLKYAAFAGAALVFFAAGRLVERRLHLALAGRTLETIFLLLVPLVLAVADELRLGAGGFAISLALGVPAVLASRTLLRDAGPEAARLDGVPFGAAFYLIAAANLLFPAAAGGGGTLLAGAVAAVGIAGALVELERRIERVRAAAALLTLGGLGYASAVLFLRAIARLHVEGAALATPLLLSAAPALLVAPRLLAREGRDREPVRAAAIVAAAIAATVALAAYLLSLGRPSSAAATASIGTAALLIACFRRPAAVFAALATASLAIVYAAGVALVRGEPAVGWPALLEPALAPIYLPLAVALLAAGGLCRSSERLRPLSGPPLAAAIAVAFGVTALAGPTPFLGAALAALAAILGASAFVLERTAGEGGGLPPGLGWKGAPAGGGSAAPGLPPVAGEGASRAEHGDVMGEKQGRRRHGGSVVARLLAGAALAALGAVLWVRPPFLAALGAATVGLLSAGYGAALVCGSRGLGGRLLRFAPVFATVGILALFAGILGAHDVFAWRAPAALAVAAGAFTVLALGARAGGRAAASAAAALAALAVAEARLLTLPEPHPGASRALLDGALTTPLLGLAILYALIGPRLPRALAAPLTLAGLVLATVLAPISALEPAPEAARHLALTAGVYFLVVLARPSAALVAFGQAAATAAAMFAVCSIRQRRGLMAVDPLALSVLGLVWIAVSWLLRTAGSPRLGGLVQRASDFAAFSVASSLAVVIWLAVPAVARTISPHLSFPPHYLVTHEALGALAATAAAFALVARRAPSVEAGCTLSAVIGAAWLVLALVAPGNRAAVPLAAVLAAGAHLVLRPAVRTGPAAGVAGATVAAAMTYAFFDLGDGWRVLTLLLCGPLLYTIGAARRHAALATLGLIAASLAVAAGTAYIGERLGATDGRTALAIGAVALALGAGLFEAARRRGPEGELDPPLAIAAALNAVAVLALLAAALVLERPGRTVIPGPDVLAGLAVLLALSFALFRGAVKVSSELLAYAGQIVFAGAAVFLRLARPDIFQSGYFQRLWPILLVILAFVALGLGTILGRYGLSVLARPLERVAVVIAVAPLGGVFVVGRGAGSLALFLSAAFYGALSATRKQARYAAAAAFFANAGLQPLFLLGGFRYLYQPAIFFGPLGLTLIVAGHAARERLKAETRDLLRIAGAFLVFASLTMSAYIDLSHRTLESLVLAAVSIAGAIAGMRLKVPAYVYLGSAFLLLDIASHVYWAGREHPWVWYVSLVALGLAVIGYFATLERRRSGSPAERSDASDKS